jgi:hypothetical protein
MTIAFYEHPFSSYVQKAKTALYEKGIPFESKMIGGRNKLLVSWGPLVIAPPLAGSLLAPLRGDEKEPRTKCPARRLDRQHPVEARAQLAPCVGAIRYTPFARFF